MFGDRCHLVLVLLVCNTSGIARVIRRLSPHRSCQLLCRLAQVALGQIAIIKYSLWRGQYLQQGVVKKGQSQNFPHECHNCFMLFYWNIPFPLSCWFFIIDRNWNVRPWSKLSRCPNSSKNAWPEITLHRVPLKLSVDPYGRKDWQTNSNTCFDSLICI